MFFSSYDYDVNIRRLPKRTGHKFSVWIFYVQKTGPFFCENTAFNAYDRECFARARHPTTMSLGLWSLTIPGPSLKWLYLINPKIEKVFNE